MCHTSKDKEDLSIAYLQAVCANASIDYEHVIHDVDSTDAILKKRVNLNDGQTFDVQLRVQLKCTSSKSEYSISDEKICYKLKIKNYNDLCKRGSSEIILCLLILPENENLWIDWMQEGLLMHGCMYWLSLKGHSLSDNTSTKNVTIDKNDVINSKTLIALLEKAAKEA